ncbi:MAG: flagellar export protein FliJ [Desulfobulbus propionicus]|nr:MAG: flagellar export protein FliJ [Desulfobulbus propionicus]
MRPFRLDTVLKIRQQAEDTARQALFAALEKEQQAKQILADHKQELTGLYQQLQTLYGQGISVHQLELIENWIAVVKGNIKKAEQNLSDLHLRTVSCRNKLLQTSTDRTIMEKMKEQQNSAYKRHLDKKERLMLDELAVLFHKIPDR